MSDLDLSRSAKALLKAAKSDGPSAAARAKIWGGVASGAGAAGVVGVSAGAIGAGIAAANGAATIGGASAAGAGVGVGAGAGIGAGAGTAAFGGGKLLAMGALFGSALTVGIAATLLGIGRSPSLMPDPQYGEPASMVQPAYTNGGAVHPSGAAANAFERDPNGVLSYGNAYANGATPLTRDGASDGRGGSALIDVPTIASAKSSGATNVSDPNNARSAQAANGARDASGRPLAGGSGTSASTTPGPATGAVRVVREDTLMRESALVAEARGALMRGDSKAALAALKAAKTLKHRELEPEELSLEAKALRAIGRDGDAASLEIVLKSRYPDHALAR